MERMGWFKLLSASCEEITRLASQELDRPLSRGERFALNLHLLYCKACRRFRRHIQATRETLLRMGEAPAPDDVVLPAASRQAIQRRLAEPHGEK